MPPDARPERFCPACQSAVRHFTPGPNGRPDATCPVCASLERHRFLALLLEGLAPYVAGATAVLDVAPSRQTTTHLQRLDAGRYVRMDFDPAADRRSVDVQGSVTDMPFPDDTFDVVVCYHVLEHVPDDRAGMRELGRVLRPGGVALVQVPWRPDADTDEDPSAPVAERVRRFGQADHVRYYGRDFEDRLRESGLDVLRLTPADVVGEEMCGYLRLNPEEAVWVIRRRGQRPGGSSSLGLAHGSLRFLYAAAERDTLSVELDTLRAEAERLRGEVSRATAAAAKWERAYRRIHDILPVRLLASASRPLRRRIGR